VDNLADKQPIRLHKEIVDFYEYIRPRDFEARMRGRLVKELGDFCRALWSDAGVHPFGSYPTELYLPTSDMDLVVVSDRVLEQGGTFGRYSSNKNMRIFGATLKSKGFISGEPEYILGAKVPLVKFVNVQTQLKIDVSFENTSGLQGVSTFKAWKEQYPAMPVLVTLIKHFLGMRGLNEPVNGGIGGFSVICLVVSMLQMMPQVQSRSMDTMHHLGDLFMEFLDLYGNRFNYHDVAICLDPPRYIPKVSTVVPR
jgi:non-canonical poly(A) RNA polymerase PAPD5/7